MEIPLSFETVGGDPYIPLSIEYKITDVRTSKVFQDWTNIAPALEASIVTAPLRIDNEKRRQERKEVAVRTDSGSGTQNVETLNIWVKNIRAY